MRPRPPANEKPLHWIGTSKRDLLRFPRRVISAIGYDLSAVQYGAQPPSAKPWKGMGPGVWELAEDDASGTYRAVYTIQFAKGDLRAACFSEEIARRHPDVPAGHHAHQAT